MLKYLKPHAVKDEVFSNGLKITKEGLQELDFVVGTILRDIMAKKKSSVENGDMLDQDDFGIEFTLIEPFFTDGPESETEFNHPYEEPLPWDFPDRNEEGDK